MDNCGITASCGEGDLVLREGAVGSLSKDWSVKSRKEGRRSGEVARTGGRGWNGVAGREREMIVNDGSVVASRACAAGVEGREGETISRVALEASLAALLPSLGIGRFCRLWDLSAKGTRSVTLGTIMYPSSAVWGDKECEERESES